MTKRNNGASSEIQNSRCSCGDGFIYVYAGV